MASFFVTAAKGTEGAVRDELKSHRFRGVRAERGGVVFEGGLGEGARACLELRTGMRVLLFVARFDAPSEAALYDGVREVDWSEHLSERTTLAVRATTRSSRLTHSQYVAQKTKDAIVDRLRDDLGSRPDVSRDDPDALVSVHLAKDVATIYLDMSGEPLFLRGYRTVPFGAPLKETLAASMLFLSGWAQAPDELVDPMCGSGTIAIEAALIARKIAPGLVTKRRFGFERWASFDEEGARALREITELARARASSVGAAPPIRGSDLDPRAVEASQKNAQRAGVRVDFAVADARALTSRRPLTVVTNPPYGERLALDEDALRDVGRALVRLPDARLALLLGHPHMLDLVPRRADKVITVMNGDIECGLALYGRTAG